MMINWREIAEENSERLLQELVSAYREACSIGTGSTSTLCVWIDQEGRVGTDEHIGNSVSAEVFEGTAKYVGKIQYFDPTHIDASLKEEEPELSDDELEGIFFAEHAEDWALQQYEDFLREAKYWEKEAELEQRLQEEVEKLTDLVGVSEVGERLGWSRQKVATYVGRGLFPEPIAELKMGPIWRWEDMEQVAKQRGWIEEPGA